MAAGKLLAESSRTADCARCNAMVRTDFEEVEGLFVEFEEEDEGRGGEEMDGLDEEEEDAMDWEGL